MKYLLLLISYFLLTNSAVSAESKTPVYGRVTERVIKNEESSSLQNMLSIPGVDKQYKACQEAKVALEMMAKCLWEGEGSVPPLPTELRKKITEASSTNKIASRAPASERPEVYTNIRGNAKSLSVDYLNDPAVAELSKVLQKKLESALLGNEKDRTGGKDVTVVDHAKFIELYKTELGKTIVNSFTSYCMETDQDTNAESTLSECEKIDPTTNQKIKTACPIYLLNKNKEKTVEKNLKNLKNASLENSKGTYWTECISSLSQVCYLDKGKISNIDSGADYDKSKTQACLIMDYVKSARKNLMVIDDQEKFYKSLQDQTPVALQNARTVKIDDKNNNDVATTVTSKDIETSYEKKNNEAVAIEIDQCFDEKTNQIKNKEACAKFIEQNPDTKKKELAEFALRQYAVGENLEVKLANDEEVKKYLKEEGYDDKKIEAITQKKEDLEAIKKEIKERFSNEREALVKSMADRIKDKVTDGEGLNAQNSNDVDTLAKIKKDIAKRPDDLKQLVHFSNIVSSYLEIDSGGKKSRNIASLYAEVNNTASKVAGTDNDAPEIKKNAQKAGLQEKKITKEDSGTILSVENLNSLLRYFSEK